MHGQTIKYNLKKRLGRGFTFEELKVSYAYATVRWTFLSAAGPRNRRAKLSDSLSVLHTRSIPMQICLTPWHSRSTD